MASSDKRKRDEESPLLRQDSTKAPVNSSLVRNNEEVSFPRGGASVLTPLELKQVANEAASDVLFGNESKETENTSRPTKKKKTTKSSVDNKDNSASGEADESSVDIVEHISFKSLKAGSLLLGQITEINKSDLCVSFTDNLSGFVTLTNISEQFTGILEDLDNDMESEDQVNDADGDSDSSDDEEKSDLTKQTKELPKLDKYFHVGQWLRCSVLLNTFFEVQNKKKQKKRIELSIEPSVVNDFEEEDLDKFTAVQCSVKSIEDHGAILDLGIQGFTGFISKTDIPNFESLLPGSVFLGNVVKKSGRSVTVNLDFKSKNNRITQVSSIDAVVPGQTIDLLCQTITKNGIIGKCFGLVSGFLSIGQLRVFALDEIKHKYSLGSNIRCRIIASLLNKSGEKVLILSILPHIMSLDNKLYETEALESFPVGYTFDSCTISGRDSEYLYVALDEDRTGQVHYSRIGDIDLLTTLKARVLGFNSVDRLYELSTDSETLKLKYLRSKDIPAGECITNCEISSVSSSGIQLKLFDNQFTAFVPPLHISDTKLVYPERKFKIGSKVKGRILNVDNRGHIFVTLKKSLVNLDEDTEIISSYATAHKIESENGKTVASVQMFQPRGCILYFFGGIRGFLPNSEISEVFVRRPEEHLRLGQTVTVKLLEVDAERSRIIATCKVSNDQAKLQKETIEQLIPGRSMVDVVVVEKTKDSLVVEMNQVGLRGVIYAGHLSDLRIEQNRAQLKKIKVGSELKGLVIDKDSRTQVFNLTLKESLINDAKKNALPISYEDIKSNGTNLPMHGYVKSISDRGIFVAFNGKFVGLVLPSYAVESRDVDIFKAFYVNQSVTSYLLRTDDEHQRFLLTLKQAKDNKNQDTSSSAAINPVDSSMKNLEDFKMGRIVDAKIKSTKKNQLNVILADNLYGRVDISEVFDNFEDIKDPKRPMDHLKKGDLIKVKIIGSHDIKGHKFLPVTHQVTKSTVLELTMKPSKLNDSEFKIQDIGDVSVGEEVIGFVNNYASNNLWLTISPPLKAKISVFDLTDDSAEFTHNVEKNFPLGSALKVTVSSVDSEHGFITVTARSRVIKNTNDAKVGDKLPARIVKISDKYILLNLGNDVIGISFATDALDDFSVPLQVAYEGMQNQIISAVVLSVDSESNKIRLSLRSANAKSRDIKSHSDIKQGDTVSALVKAVTDKGIFVYLSTSLEAFVPVSKLSDSFLKEWKKFYKPMQCVVGKVINSDEDSRILLTLRESEVNGELQVLKNYSDIKVGDIFDGNIKNVTEFGVFVKLDNTMNITGLAHRSEIAEKPPQNLSSLFGVGDRVKAFVLKISPEKKQISLSLKASHFAKLTGDNEKSNNTETIESVEVPQDDDIMDDVNYNNSDSEVESELEDSHAKSTNLEKPAEGLSLSAGFDWTASILDQVQVSDESEGEGEDEDFTSTKRSKRQKRQTPLVEDKTIDINSRAPESVGDFERLIMGNPNSSVIWMNYMAFQLQLSELDKAREIAERALKTINFREEAEKLNIWLAMLNLENTFGSDENVEDVFKRASQYMDSYTIHTKLLNIYRISEKFDQAEELFKVTAKKFGLENTSVWISWGEFLLSQNKPQEARTILSKALKSLPKRSHIDIVRKFAQLEFGKGDPERGRSLFEGLLADAPKRIDLWNVYLDQEIKGGDKKKVEGLFERVIAGKITRKQAKFFFNKWLQFEEAQKDDKSAEYVKAKAIEYAEKHPKPAAE